MRKKLDYTLPIMARTSLAMAALVMLVLMGTMLGGAPAASAQSNSPATGQPTISGTMRVGETLTAVTSSIADADGLDDAVFSYQWIRVESGSNESDISGENGSTYTLVPTDQGKTIKVRISFTDDAGNEETLTSEASAEVRAGASAPGAPTRVSFGPNGRQGGLTLTWINPEWMAPEETVTGYQILRWERADGQESLAGCDYEKVIHVNEPGSDFVTYTDTDVVEGVIYRYFVKAINSNGVGPQARSSSRQYRTHALWPDGVAGGPDAPTNLRYEPITYGSQLTGIELTWDAPDGEVTGYQILRRLPRECELGYRVYVENTNSTDTRWVDTNVESHTLYEYHVRAINDFGVGDTKWRESTSVLAPGVEIAMIVSKWYGSLAVGSSHRLRIAVNHLERDDDPDTVEYILRGDVTLDTDGSDADECEGDGLGEDVQINVVDEKVEYFDAIFGGGSCGDGTYTVTLALNDGDGDEIMSLSWKYVVGPGHLATFPVDITWLPAISGTAQVGETLTADTSRISDDDGLDNAIFTYLWSRNDGTMDTVLAAETATTYLVTTDDIGSVLKVSVSYTDDEGNDETLTSAATATVAAKPNSAATGAPTISGTAQVGQTLTASTTGISDSDGLTNVSYSYQWLADDADISAATASTYLLTTSEMGKAIKVRVSFTDEGGNDEVLTSSGTGAVGPEIQQQRSLNTHATGAPTIRGTTQVGQTLTADTSEISDDDGLDDVFYSYQWIRNDGTTDADISIATSSTYMLVTDDQGKTIKVRVSFTDDEGNQETRTSAPTAAVAATVPGAPGSLSVSVNDTGKLDVSWGAPESNGGSSVTGYRVQWKEAPDSWDTPADVSETTVAGTNHTVAGLTDGVEYTFRVFAVNSAGDGSASEDESGTPRETSAPTVSSATVDGATLTLTFSEGLAETPRPAVTTFTVNVEDNQRGVNTVAISGSTVTLTLASAVTSTDDVSVGYTVPSDTATARLKDLSDNPAESFTGQAVTNNTAAAQTPLTASIHDEATSHDGQEEFTFELRFSENLEGFSYKTLRDNAFTVTGGKVEGVRRLTPPSNTKWQIKILPTSNGDVTIVLPITEDCTADGAVCTGDRKLSNRLELTVSGPTSQQTSQQRQESTAATGSPTISGTVQVGQTLAASTTGIVDTDGLTNAAYSYQWIANDGSSDSDIADATASAYTLVVGDAGKTIKVKVTFTDDGGNEETLTSAPTAAVAATVPGAPGGLSVSVNDTGKLDVSWSVPGSNGGSAITGYRVQWKEAADSWDTPADVSETTVTGTNHTVAGLTDGVEYTFRVFAVNSAGDSTASEEGSGTPRETSAPTVSSGTVDGATLTLTFSEGLTETPLPAVATFTVNVGGDQRGVNTVAISGSRVTLTLASAVTSTDDVSVGYTVPSDTATARLEDLSDNPAESFTGQAVVNNTAAAQTPLTASIHDEPSSHDGQAEFTFELRFSENLEGFSYKTLRDNAFTVTGGKVEGARRLVSGSNTKWQIKIRPTSNGDVTIVLPITEDCTADGAVCTGDRKLSNRLEIIVSGPNG